MQCFQKDPNLRVSARKLLKHAWIIGCRRAEAPVAKAPANFSQAVEEVKQWNKALNSSDANLRTSAGSEAPPASKFPGGTPAKGSLNLKPRSGAQALRAAEFTDDDNWDDDFATAISPTALQLPHLRPQDNFGGMLSSDRLKSFASFNDGKGDSSYDDDFEGELMTIKGAHLPTNDVDLQEQTIRPIHRKPLALDTAFTGHERNNSIPGKSSAVAGSSAQRSPPKQSLNNKFELPVRHDVVYREQSVEDYSDLFVENDNVFNERVDQVKQGIRGVDSPQLFHPSDLTSLPRSMMTADGGSVRKRPPSRPSVIPDRPMRRTRSSVEIQKFAEHDDEDFSDVFGPEGSAASKAESEKASEDGGLMLMSKVSSNSWLGDDEDEDDPFAQMDQGWDEMDLEANIARDRHARLAEKVEDLVRSLKSEEGEAILAEVSEDLLAMLWENSEAKNLIISSHGLLPILEILEPCTAKSRQYMILQLLKVVNAVRDN